jgi:pimeloyl-ACP methyl ester carboxylesterase
MMNQDIINWKNKGQYLNCQGHQIFYFQEGHGENLLILHGYPYSSYEWKDMLKVLTQHYTVTVFDILGMGFSDKPQNHKYSYEEHCTIVYQLLQHLNISETHILSHDLGVSIAQELLAQNTDGTSRENREGGNFLTIQSIAFMNGGLFMDVYRPRLIQRLLSQTPSFIGRFISQKLTKAAVNKSVKSIYGLNTQPSDDFLDEQWAVLNYKNGKSIAYLIGRLVFDKYNYQTRWIAAMQKTAIPMCYICGPYDPNSGLHMAKRYEELIPNPKVYLLKEDIGHWAFLEDEAGVLTAYSDFMENHSKY